MKFKSVLGAFVFVCFASFIALLIYVQTKSFGNFVSKVVSDLSLRRVQAKVSLKDVKISLFPPGLELNKVSVRRKTDKENLRAEFGKLGFYINLIEIEERRLSFGEIRISDSFIQYDFPESDDETNEIDQKVIDQIFEITDKAPVRVDSLVIENSMIHLNHDLLEARRLKLFKKTGRFTVRFHVSNIKPSADSELKLDEVWGDLEIGRKHLDIYRLKLMHEAHSMVVKGEVRNYRLLKGSAANLKGEIHLFLKDLDQMLGISNTIKMSRGFADLSFNLGYQNQKFEGGALVDVKDLESTLAFAQTLQGEIKFNQDMVTLIRAELRRDEEQATLHQAAGVFDLKNKLILPHPLVLNMREYTLTNALRLVPELKPLRGKLTGRLTLKHDRGDFYIKPEDGFLATDVALVVGENKPFRVLTIKSARLTETDVSVVNNEVRISSSLKLPRSSLEVDGFVNKKNIRFSIIDALVDLEDLGDIANLGVKGAGPMTIDVSGSGKDVDINLRGKMKDFEVLGYQLGLSDTNITVALGQDNVIINKLESQYGATPISLTGAVNYDSLDLAIGINSPSTNYPELSRVLTPVFSKMDFLPPDFNFNAKVDANVYGNAKLKDLKIRSRVDFTDLTGYGETINVGSLNINMENEILFLNQFHGKKGRGDINGNFTFVLPQDVMKVDLSWTNVDLSSLNSSRLLHLNVDGKINGTLKGEGKTKDYQLLLSSTMSNTRSSGHRFEDSHAQLRISPDRIKGDVSFLGQILHSKMDMALDLTGPSSLELSLAVPDIKPLMVAFLGDHIQAEELTGRAFFDLKTNFNGEFKDMNLTGHLKDIAFNHPDFNLNYSNSQPDFAIKNNAIRNWGLNIRQPDIFINSRGEGSFGKSVLLVNELHFNSKLLEVLLAPVLSADGFIRNQIRIDGKGDDYSLTLASSANKLNTSVQGLAFPINDLDYDLEYSDNRLQVRKIQSSLEAGYLSLKGDIYFDNDEPDVNLKYQLERAEIPILGRSSINVTGEGIILGNEMPYNLTGDLLLNKALVLNELSDFSSRSNAFAQVRFLPRNQESVLGKLLNLNVSVKADNPIRITNSLMDVSLRGEVRLSGNPSRPRGEGRVYAPVNSSRIFFKNNEYLITSADINFFNKKDITNPDFDIQAMTNMSTYKVYAKAYGDLERFNFDLTSDPALPRNSILSLIAFGYTDEIGMLRAEDQQSLTQMGVGSFVLDRFKISDILNKQFGVQVNVGAVFEQTEQSLLSGRSQGSSGTGPGDLGRTRSATRIELKKRLDEALSLSVSSTMGGYIGSRQSMNLTYSLNRKVQLEGVYELRTAAEGEEDIINNSNSIGGDVKFRWSFK